MKNFISRRFVLLLLSGFILATSTCKKLEKSMLVSTGDISNITTNTADASGNIVDIGAGATQYGHCYGKTGNPTISSTKTELGTPSGNGGFTSQLKNLEAGTQYYIKTYISDGKTTVYGKETSFSTIAPALPSITTTTITSITTTTATSGGNISSDGGSPVTARGVCWHTSTGPTVANNKTSDGAGTDGFTSNITGLTGGTTYYVRAYAVNSSGTAYGNELTFVTNSSSGVVPTLTTTLITSVTSTSAVSGGNITNDGGSSVTSRGVCWSTGINPLSTGSHTTNGAGTGSFVSNITGLSANTKYYVRAFAINSAGTSYGNELDFTTNSTNPTAPTAAIASATSVTNTTATLNGAANANGSTTTVTFEYGTTVLYGYELNASPATATGSTITTVSAALSGLTPGTLYHYRVKAVNPSGTAYSDDMPFTTLQLPVATTGNATSVANTEASLNGIVNAINISTTVTFDYGTTIAYGLNALATPSPVNGSIPTNVTAGISGLVPGTTYHFRVKAVSTSGTTYGEDVTFTTLQPPTASTEAATSLSNTTASITGIVNANNSQTTVTFEYGTSLAYGGLVTAKESPLTGNSPASVSADLSGLLAGTIYHYKVHAASAGGTADGNDLTFKTLQAPTVSTAPATSIANTTASLNGTVNANDLSSIVTFEYGLTNAYGSVVTAVQSPVSGSNSTGVSASITGLSEGTIYHFRVKAVSEAGTSFGADEPFTTLMHPTAISNAASGVTSSTATLNGTINPNSLSTTVTFEYGTTTSYGSTVNATPSPVNGSSNTAVSAVITPLTPNTLYHFRVKAVSVAGTTYGDDQTFNTPCSAPTSITNAATLVTNTTATMNGSINANSFSTTVTFEFGLTTGYGSVINATPNTVTGSSSVAVSAGLTGLIPNTQYHFRVKSVSCGGTIYGSDQIFTSLCTAPSATTNSGTSVTNTTATFNGTVNANNFSTTVTFEYGFTTSYGSSAAATPGTVTGTTNTNVSSAVSGLMPYTTYHYRLKAVNCSGTVYGSDITFTTLCTAPTAATNAATSVTSSTATLNGTVNANNFSTTVTFEYGLTTSYGSTINATPNTVTGTTSTAVSASLTGLTPGTVYHFRVKSVNCGGTIYGSDQSFTSSCLAPTATTGIGNGTSTSMTLRGTITANGCSTTVTFEWSIAGYGTGSVNATPNIVSGNSATSVSASVSTVSFPIGASVLFKVKAVNSIGTVYGSTNGFILSL